MTRPFFLLLPAAFALALGLGASSSARADMVCGNVLVEPGRPLGPFADQATALGYTVRKVEREKSCIEVEGRDRNGAEIELYFNPSTGDIVPYASNLKILYNIPSPFAEKAKELGYTPIKIEQENGHIELKGYDRNGAKIEINLDANTGNVLSW